MQHSMRATTLSPDSIAKFQTSMSARGRAENTISAYSGDLRTLLAELEEEEVTMEEFEMASTNWLNGNRKRVSPKTTRRRLTSIKAFCTWAGWAMNDLSEYKPPPGVPTNPHPLPEGIEGVRRMIEQCGRPNHRALVALCGLVGLRVAEALNVEASHIDVSSMQITVIGKGDKTRFLPISDEAWTYIMPSLIQAGVNGTKLVMMGDRTARSLITRLGERAGLRRAVASHDLRATFATEVYNQTLDMRLVQELLGHSSVETTQGYVGVKKQALVAAVNFAKV